MMTKLKSEFKVMFGLQWRAVTPQLTSVDYSIKQNMRGRETSPQVTESSQVVALGHHYHRLMLRCRAYIFLVVKNVLVDISAHAQ